MNLEDLVPEIHANAQKKGFWDEPVNIPEKLALIHGEVSEALEEYRDGYQDGSVRYTENGKPEGFGTELADIIIRTIDLAERQGINLEEQIRLKHAYNLSRPHKHGKVC